MGKGIGLSSRLQRTVYAMFLVTCNLVSISVLQVEPAVYIVMGANIGASVTNTIVSLVQSRERNQEFRRAFAGAVVHDIFNWLSVLVFLPLEVITGYLRRLTGAIIKGLQLGSKKTNQKLLKVVTEPFAKLIIQIDMKTITKIALGDKASQEKSLIKTCVSKTPRNVTKVNATTNLPYVETVIDKEDTCSFLFKGTTFSDTVVGVILLVVSIALLCICLICIVKLLHSMLRGQMEKVIKKTTNADFPGPFKHLTGYLAILVGAGMTMLVQSCSIFISTLTPLIRVEAVTIEHAFPLILGSNIGTTATGFLAALTSSTNLDEALQIAFCHLFFNISGTMLWYPIPYLRRVLINFAKSLADKAVPIDYRRFAIGYLQVLHIL